MRIVFATNNEAKAREARQVLGSFEIPVLTLKDLDIVSDPDESGETFAENSRIKALDVYRILKERGGMADTVVIADDSGLCIDYLGGEPGVRSARFMGHSTSYNEKNREILRLLEDAGDGERGAAFVCHVCAVDEYGRVYDAESSMPGEIAHEPKGEEGFGYDPIFYVPEFGMTSGELTPEQKNSISHRGKVLRKMREILCQNQLL